MRKIFALVILIFFLFESSSATEFIVGVSPATINLGKLERGENKIVNFNVVTPSTETLIVILEAEQGNLDFFSREAYKNFTYNYSEEILTGWVEFLNNPVELKPSNEVLKTVGGEIKGWREVSFILTVPKDAEPGYHLIKIKPIPAVPSENLGQAGARVVALTDVNVLFHVPGDAIRDGVILDVVPGNYVGNRLEIDTYFKNTGTVTISARAYHEIIANNSLSNISSSTELVKPGETKILKAYLDVYKDMPQEIEIKTTVNYVTGFKYKVSKISLPPAVAQYVTIPKYQIPWWMIVIIIIIIASSILFYKWY
jgi:hypothetical protein